MHFVDSSWGGGIEACQQVNVLKPSLTSSESLVTF